MYTRTDVDFCSHGTRCAAWLYRPDPDKVKNPPIIIMAHGFAAERTFRLPAFAEYFAEQGLAVFLFDYRCFGDSEGEPRNFVSFRHHLQDWEAAITHVKTLAGIDNKHIALWGSSFSGGHVIVTAANNPQVSAVIAQVPFVDGISSTLSRGSGFMINAAWHGMRDMLHYVTFRQPHYISVVDTPDSFAAMNTPESKPGYLRMKPSESEWQNSCPARILPLSMFYRPIKKASKVLCPVLLIMGEKDSLISSRAIEKTAAKMPSAEILSLPVGHFEVYFDEWFEHVVEKETAFLTKHLLSN